MTILRPLILAAVLFAPPLLAQTPSTPPPASGAAADETDARALRLSLDEAIETAMKRNLGVQLQSYDYRISGERLTGSTGIFDWNTFANINTSSTEQPIVSTIQASESTRTTANFGVNQLIPIGGNYSIGFNNARNASNDQFTFINPSYSSSLGFNLAQPLLRDFGVDVTRRGISLARNNLGISREAFRNLLTQTALQVEQAYLDLIFARQNLEVKRQSHFLARDQERITQIRIDVGASAPLDILQPRVAIATRDEEVILAEAQIRNAEDRLRQLMNLDPDQWDRPIVPTEPVTYSPMDVDVAAAVAKAMELRPEVKQASLSTDSRRIETVYARNQVLPQLDLRLDYGFAGLGPKPILDPNTGEPIGVESGGYQTALEQVYGFDSPSWTFGFNFGLPVRNIIARAERRRAELDLERSESNEERTRQQIAVDVRQAARDIDTASRRIVATRAARDAAEQNVDAERKRYENGMTTNFNVLLVQQELSDARSREILSLVEYRKAVANFHRAVGDLLEVRDISIDELPQFPDATHSWEDVRWLNSSRYWGGDDPK